MNVAVFSLTRDRIDYTQHCFATLAEYAGCDYDHYVLDNGSTDGTADWLRITYQPHSLILEPENLGVGGGLNRILDHLGFYYDVIVSFDNDCELTQPNTIRDLAQLAFDGNCILSPRILGLNNPPPTLRTLTIGDERILETTHLGAICRAVPAWVFDTFRFPPGLPLWGGDEGALCGHFREQGGTCGYVERLEAWHYRTTNGQHTDHPSYFERRVLEGGPV